MTPLADTPLPPQDGTVTLPPDRDLGAMVEAILKETRGVTDGESAHLLRIRLSIVQGDAERLAVALEREQAVMEEMAKIVEGLQSIVAESEGVVGWHLNDAVAPWGEFEFIADIDEAFKNYEVHRVP